MSWRAPDVARIEDLAGKPVNVDVRGSGTAMTASLLFDALGIPVDARHDPQDTALERLRRGDIAALVYVAGKPARLFGGIPADAGLNLLPVPATPALLETYLPAEFRPDRLPDPGAGGRDGRDHRGRRGHGGLCLAAAPSGTARWPASSRPSPRNSPPSCSRRGTRNGAR